MRRQVVVVVLALGVLALSVGIVVVAPDHAGSGGVSIRALLAAGVVVALAAALVRVDDEQPWLRLSRRLLPLGVVVLGLVVGWVTVVEAGSFPGSVSEACVGYDGPRYAFEVTFLPAAAWCVSADGVRTPHTDAGTSVVLTTALVASILLPALVATWTASRGRPPAS